MIRRDLNGEILTARIVETEAYLGENDLASHGRKKTKRSAIMFGPPMHVYVYFIYGRYFMLNFVTEREGVAGAVLIRAVEPVQGNFLNLTNGPAKLALALGITRDLNGLRLGAPEMDLVIDSEAQKKVELVTTTRIGISQSKDLLLRFYDSKSKFVSRG